MNDGPGPTQPTTSPLVSIVIPAYNVAPFIVDALDSAFAQSVKDFEVIVVNDGSVDSLELESAIAPFRDRIQYLVQDNQGPSAARNAGIRRARGEFVAFLDADDTLLPNFLEEHLSRARADPDADVFYGDLLVIGDVPEAGRTVMESSASFGTVDFESLVTQRCNPMLCSLVRRRVLLAHGAFDESMRRSEDFDLWLRLAHAGVRFNYTTRVVARYRVRAGALTADVVAMIRGIRAVFDKCARTLLLSDRERTTLAQRDQYYCALERLHEGKRAFLTGDFAAARAALHEANRTMRTRKLQLVNALLATSPRLLLKVYRLRERLRGLGAGPPGSSRAGVRVAGARRAVREANRDRAQCFLLAGRPSEET